MDGHEMDAILKMIICLLCTHIKFPDLNSEDDDDSHKLEGEAFPERWVGAVLWVLWGNACTSLCAHRDPQYSMPTYPDQTGEKFKGSLEVKLATFLKYGARVVLQVTMYHQL